MVDGTLTWIKYIIKVWVYKNHNTYESFFIEGYISYVIFCKLLFIPHIPQKLWKEIVEMFRSTWSRPFISKLNRWTKLNYFNENEDDVDNQRRRRNWRYDTGSLTQTITLKLFVCPWAVVCFINRIIICWNGYNLI